MSKAARKIGKEYRMDDSILNAYERRVDGSNLSDTDLPQLHGLALVHLQDVGNKAFLADLEVKKSALVEGVARAGDGRAAEIRQLFHELETKSKEDARLWKDTSKQAADNAEIILAQRGSRLLDGVADKIDSVGTAVVGRVDRAARDGSATVWRANEKARDDFERYASMYLRGTALYRRAKDQMALLSVIAIVAMISAALAAHGVKQGYMQEYAAANEEIGAYSPSDLHALAWVLRNNAGHVANYISLACQQNGKQAADRSGRIVCNVPVVMSGTDSVIRPPAASPLDVVLDNLSSDSRWAWFGIGIVVGVGFVGFLYGLLCRLYGYDNV